MMSVVKKLSAPISAILLVASSITAFAQTPNIVNACPTGSQFGNLCNINGSNFGGVVGRMVTMAFIVAIIIALGYLIYGGVKWILSEGDKTKVEESRNHVIAAVIGLIVVFLAYFVLNIVVNFFAPGASLSNLILPNISGIGQ